MDLRVCAVEGDLHAVQLHFAELFAVLLCQADPVGVETGDKPAGVTDELEKILPHSRFPSREGHLRDPGAVADIKDLLPLSGGELFLVRQSLAGGIAVHALLVAVPFAVFCHGADHQVHAVRRPHERGVVADAHVMHVRGHLLAVSDLAERCVDCLYILPDALAGEDWEDLLDALGGAIHDALDVLLADLPPVKPVCLLYELCQDHSPDKTHRHNIGAVDDGYAGIKRIFFCLGRNQVNADDARSVGVQRCVQNIPEGKFHVGFQISDRPGFAEYRGYFSHCVLSAPRTGAGICILPELCVSKHCQKNDVLMTSPL